MSFFATPPQIIDQYTFALRQDVVNTSYWRITPIRLFRYRHRIRAFGHTIARFTITGTLDTINATFPTGNSQTPAIVNIQGQVTVELSNIATARITAGATVGLYLDPNFRFIDINPQTLYVRARFRLFGFIRFRVSGSVNVNFLSARFQINQNPSYTINFPSPINRTITLRPANGTIRTVSGFLIVDGDIIVT